MTGARAICPRGHGYAVSQGCIDCLELEKERANASAVLGMTCRAGAQSAAATVYIAAMSELLNGKELVVYSGPRPVDADSPLAVNNSELLRYALRCRNGVCDADPADVIQTGGATFARVYGASGRAILDLKVGSPDRNPQSELIFETTSIIRWKTIAFPGFTIRLVTS